MPPALGRDLLALEMEDHYLRIHTALGSDLILLRLRDALAELGPSRGRQVHRSWWVAEGAIASAERDARPPHAGAAQWAARAGQQDLPRPGQSRRAGSAEPVRIGILGAGAMGTAHAAAYAAMRRSDRRRRVLARPGARPLRCAAICKAEPFTDAAALIQRADVDAIDVCLPSAIHHAFVVPALEGRQACVLRDAAGAGPGRGAAACATPPAAPGRLLQVGLLMRSLGAYEHIKAVARSGEHGRLLSVATWRLGSYLHPDAPDHKAHYGDPSTELMTFDFDFVHWLMGPPGRLSASAARTPDGRPGEISALLSYPDGRHATVIASGLMPPGSPFTVGFRALFERAAFEHLATFERRPAEDAASPLPTGTAPARPCRWPTRNPYQVELQRFVDCIRGRADPALLDADRAIEALLLSLATQSRASRAREASHPERDLPASKTGRFREEEIEWLPGKDSDISSVCRCWRSPRVRRPPRPRPWSAYRRQQAGQDRHRHHGRLGADGDLGRRPVVGIDVRPADGKLYGLTAAGQLVVIDHMSGKATPGSMLSQKVALGPRPVVDFNPAADRLRVIAADGQSLRINVDDGATTVDKPLNYDAADANNGKKPMVAAGAYTNSAKGAKSTELFHVDGGTGALVLQSPPNDGVLKTRGAVGVANLGDAVMDIDNEAEGKNTAYLIAGGTLYTIDLATGKATQVGAVKGMNGKLGRYRGLDSSGPLLLAGRGPRATGRASPAPDGRRRRTAPPRPRPCARPWPSSARRSGRASSSGRSCRRSRSRPRLRPPRTPCRRCCDRARSRNPWAGAA